MEIFKDIKGYEGLYQVSNLGNVKSLKYGKERILKPGLSKVGYLTVYLYNNNCNKTYSIHRLVAQTFIQNLGNKPQVNHINGVKTDNRAENLEWCSCKENIKHSYNIGLSSNKGEKHSQSKLTTQEVLTIRNDNRLQRLIAKDYNVHQSLISKIKNCKRWEHINLD